LKEDREFITALARGLSVIEAFNRDNAKMTLSEVASRTGLSPATARRCLWTLERLGYVGSEGRDFMLRPKVLSLGAAFLEAGRFEEMVQPILRDIVNEVGDSASLGVMEGDEILYLANFSGKRFVRLTAGAGSRFPAYAVSIGRVLLAALSDEELDAYFERVELRKLTPYTVTDRSQLRMLVEDVRQSGYVVVQDELEAGLAAVAVPIRLRSGRVVAGLNCSGFTRSDSSEALLASRFDALRRGAERINEVLRQVPSLAGSLDTAKGPRLERR
jgi:IclR family transcriptional regulator, pca regulon regulatory protein